MTMDTTQVEDDSEEEEEEQQQWLVDGRFLWEASTRNVAITNPFQWGAPSLSLSLVHSSY